MRVGFALGEADCEDEDEEAVVREAAPVVDNVCSVAAPETRDVPERVVVVVDELATTSGPQNGA